MRLTKEQLYQIWKKDKHKERKLLFLALAITAAIFLFSLMIRYNAYYYNEKFVSGQYIKSLFTWVRFFFVDLFHLNPGISREEVIAQIGENIYLGSFARLKITFMALASGAALAIAGAIFQTIYRNPMATPNMLGATAGVSLGNILMIVLYSGVALELVYVRYRYCYLLTAVCVVGVLLLGKLAGDRKGNPSVMEMVMMGSVVSQALNVFTQYFMYNLEDEDLLYYQELNLGTYQNLDAVSMTLFSVMMTVSILPMLLLRYRFNAAGIDDTDARTMGISAGPIRLVGQLCGILMVTTAMIHCGQIGMITLVVPHLVRMVVGADFKKVCIYSALSGGCLLMISRLVTSFILIAGEEVPVTFILNIFLTPLFMVILAKQRRGFE